MVVVDCRTRTRAAGSKKKQVRVSIYTPLAKQWRTTIFGMALSGNVSPWGCPDLAMVSGRLIGGWAVACLGPRPCSSQRLMLGYDSAQLLPQCQEYQWSTSGGRHCRILELFLAFLSAVCELFARIRKHSGVLDFQRFGDARCSVVTVDIVDICRYFHQRAASHIVFISSYPHLVPP